MKKIILGFVILSALPAFADYSKCTAKCSFTNTPVAANGSWNVYPAKIYELGDVTIDYQPQDSYSDLKSRLKDACQQEIIRENLHLIPSIKSSWTVYSVVQNGSKVLGSQSDICK